MQIIFEIKWHLIYIIITHVFISDIYMCVYIKWSVQSILFRWYQIHSRVRHLVIQWFLGNRIYAQFIAFCNLKFITGINTSGWFSCVRSEAGDLFPSFWMLSAQEGPSGWLPSQDKSKLITPVCPLCFTAHASPYYPVSFSCCWSSFFWQLRYFLVLYLILKSKRITMMHRFKVILAFKC